MLARFGDIFVQQCLHAVGAEPATVHIRKESRCASLPWFLEPTPEGFLCNLCERRTSLFAALTDALHMRTAAEHYRVSVEVDDFRNPQPRLRGQQ
ncbi:hypothetical protein ASE29_26640 [Ensifer sp. Root74]|nr:hypothetical protein ASE29_26640 [Ensifer sp. Root74]